MSEKKIWNINGEKSSQTGSDYTSENKEASMIYNSPDTILNEYAAEVYRDTDKLFKGLVTESIDSGSSQVTYALYIVAPQIKNYMYRLIEVNVPSLIQPYPLEITLFAKDPKNHRTYTCTNVAEFRKKLLTLIESPLTRAILNHLKTLVEIGQQSIENNFHFSLTDTEPSKAFTIKTKAQPIILKKIILANYLEEKTPNVWARIISNTNLIIESKDSKGLNIKQEFTLFQFLSLYQTQPILELKLTLPIYQFYSNSETDVSDLIFTLNTTEKNVKFDFYYDSEKELTENKAV